MKDNFKKGLIVLGIGTLIVVGIVSYFNKEKPYLTWEEYIATIEVYNRKMEEIRADCKNDVRCSNGKIIFKVGLLDKIIGISVDKLVTKNINTWIEKDEEDPDTYKLAPK